MKAELVSIDTDGVFHGEGGFWDSRAERIRFVDLLRGDIMTWERESLSRHHVSDVAAVIRSRRQGGHVIATERGFALVDDDFSPVQEIAVFDATDVRMNEGGCDASGRFFCGSMAYDGRAGGGRLYRLDPDLSLHVALESVTIPNGLVWDAAGTTAFHADTAEGRIWAYEYDPTSGAFGERRSFVAFDGDQGMPDGVSIDTEDGLWVAMWGGGAVRRYDVGGALDAVVEVPAVNVTSCAFGGPESRTLYITTSRQHLETPEQHAGGLFAVDPGATGAVVHEFAG
ncbi:sugar lactone lactonase YvrE [Microbacterium sp. W4I4]|uniref:SMP-30/gluconolactonase/LRE family protein n=1 Tax=Microbacterium sp. W4I4 TaxID=3042295 RepID=UPI00277FF6E8|nr:SMP-30/gluconolactonase/LRE family protein [Microbacterium sp. W4I4]MDQ0614955.1 sugar lactone lactonase YvrE [Microbacterium sp. W4I4]